MAVGIINTQQVGRAVHRGREGEGKQKETDRHPLSLLPDLNKQPYSLPGSPFLCHDDLRPSNCEPKLFLLELLCVQHPITTMRNNALEHTSGC